MSDEDLKVAERRAHCEKAIYAITAMGTAYRRESFQCSLCGKCKLNQAALLIGGLTLCGGCSLDLCSMQLVERRCSPDCLDNEEPCAVHAKFTMRREKP